MSILSDRINTLLHPRSVAIIGASDNPSAIGYWPLYYSKLYGYAGDLFAVNPKYQSVQDVVCLPDISGLPTDLDLAVVATPKDVFLTQLRQGQWEDRAKSIVLFSSGFGEVPDHAKDEELVASLHRRGITLLGPNSIGFLTARIGLAATFTQVLQKHGPSHMAQPIAFISQSGAFGARSYSALRYAGISVAYFVSTGNEAGLGVVDFVDGAQALMDVKALFIYLENGHDGSRLLDCVDRAVGRGMKVVVLASGRSVAGQRAAASHTGAVAPEWRILRRLLEEAGAVVVDGIRDLIGAAGLLASGKRIAGRRIGIVTSSGGAGVQAADAAEERRFTVPELPRELQMRLSEHVPYFGSLRNPVDLTGSVLGGADSVGHVVSKMLHSDSVDALLVDVTKPHVGAVAAAATLSEKVVVMTMADATTDDLREMVELGVAGANDARDCLAAMEVLVERPSLRSPTEDEDIEFVERAGRHNEGALRSSSQSPL